MDISKYILDTLNDNKNAGFRALIGLQLVNSGQSQCYISQMGDVLSKNFSLPVSKVIEAIKESDNLYRSIVDLKIEVSNILVDVSDKCASQASKMQQIVKLLMGQEVTKSWETVDETGAKIKETVRNKINPQIARQILTHEILGEDRINTETDLSEARTELIKEKRRVVRLLPKAEKERIESLFDTQQKRCLDSLNNKEVGNKIISLGGAVRCGKTYIQAYYSLLHIEWLYSTSIKQLKEMYNCEEERMKGQIFFIGKTAPSVYQNIFSGIFAGFKINFSLPKAKAFLWDILNFKIRLIGYGKVSLESLKGVTADLIIVDESEHLDEEGYNYILSRLSNPWSKLIMTWNPKTPSHWLWQKVKNEESQKKNMIKHFNFSLLDCEFADKHFISMLEANHGKNSPMYKRFVLGLPASVSGQVYSQFQEDKHTFNDDIDFEKYKDIYIGYDHGHNSPRVYVAVGVYFNNKGISCADIIDELYYPKGHGDTKKNADYLRELEIFYSQFPAIRKLFLPHDAGDQKRLLEPLGYPIANASKKLTVNSGIGLIQSLLTSSRLRINAKCKNLINELFLYSYTEKDDDSVVSENDHALDALRYAIVSSGMFNKTEDTAERSMDKFLSN